MKLASLSWGEVCSRSAQAVQKRTDLFQTRLGLSLAEAGSGAPSGTFLFKPGDLPGILSCLRDELPSTVQETLARADRICEHHFDLLGYRALDYGKEINWHKDAVSGKVAPLAPWYKIPFLDYDHVGDVKVTWELNRHQHLIILAKAYLLSGNERYVSELMTQWRSWQRANRYPFGVNWASSLEVAFRSLSWLWIRALLSGCAAVPVEFWSELDRALNLSGRHIERYLSTYFSPNTHLIGEGVALFFIGTLSSSPRAKAWQALGWQIVVDQSERQVQSDGFHFEQSTYYHVYTVDFFLHSYLSARANGISIPNEFEQRIVGMLDALATLCKGGPAPRFGDDDGGRLFDGQRNAAPHLTDPLVTGAVLFHRPDFKAIHPRLIEETVWLLGPKGAKEFAALNSVAREPEPLEALPAAGLYVLTDSTTRERLVIDAGEQGAHGGGHSHADALSLQFSVDGNEVLTDPGTYVYVSGAEDRRQYRSTAAHNTVTVDHKDQMDSSGPFPWASKAAVLVELAVRGQNFTLVRASERGYERLPKPVSHTRTVFHLDGSLWFIHDQLTGSGVHELEVNWHFAPGIELELHENGAEVASVRTKAALQFVEDSNWKQVAAAGLHSPVYGQQRSSESLRCTATVPLPYCFGSLLYVLEKDRWGAELKRLEAQGAYLYVGEYGTYAFLNRMNRGGVHYGPISANADYLCFGRNADGLAHLILCNATMVRGDGRLLFESEKPVSYFEAMSSPSGMQQWCSAELSYDAEVLEEVMKKALSSAEILGARR